MDEALSMVESEDRSILIGSSGSLLDPLEVPEDILRKVLECIEGTDCGKVLVETRLDTVDEQSLGLLQECLPGKKIEIEFGLESSNQDVLKYCLNKDVDLRTIDKQIELIHSFGFTTSANVIIGTPLLGTEEQIRDAASTIGWAMDHGADSTVLFPVNVRRHTLLESMLHKGIYAPINHILVPLALSGLDDRALATVSLSWADPNQIDDDCIIARPSDDGCPGIYEFYNSFMAADDPADRRGLISSILAESAIPIMHSAPKGSLMERAERACDLLGIRMNEDNLPLP
jgi:hypothetical protein